MNDSSISGSGVSSSSSWSVGHSAVWVALDGEGRLRSDWEERPEEDGVDTSEYVVMDDELRFKILDSEMVPRLLKAWLSDIRERWYRSLRARSLLTRKSVTEWSVCERSFSK